MANCSAARTVCQRSKPAKVTVRAASSSPAPRFQAEAAENSSRAGSSMSVTVGQLGGSRQFLVVPRRDDPNWTRSIRRGFRRPCELLAGSPTEMTSVARQWRIVTRTAAARNFNSSISGAFARTAFLAASSCSSSAIASALPSPWRYRSKAEPVETVTAIRGLTRILASDLPSVSRISVRWNASDSAKQTPATHGRSFAHVLRGALRNKFPESSLSTGFRKCRARCQAALARGVISSG